MIKTKNSIKLILGIVIFLILFLFSFSTASKAAVGSGGSSGSTSGGAAKWPWAYGDPWDGNPKKTTDAWKDFYKAARDPKASTNNHGYTDAEVSNFIDTKLGFSKGGTVNGVHYSLSGLCKISQYIWWYGEPDGSTWYAAIGSNATGKGPQMGRNKGAKDAWSKYLAMQGSTWGKASLICSAGFLPPEDPIEEITVQAKSKFFIWNGQQKVVTGYNLIEGELRKGDTITTSAQGKGTAPGNYPTDFTEKTKVYDSKKVDVTSKWYEVTELKGKLTIAKAKVKEKCDRRGTDSITAIVKNIEMIIPVDISKTASDEMDSVYRSETKNKKALSVIEEMPAADADKSKWDVWKAELSLHKDKRNVKVNLKNRGSATKYFSEYGGVVDVWFESEREKMTAVFCQPMQRHEIITPYKKDDGTWGYTVTWSDWEPDGEEVIESVKTETVDPLYKTFQALQVNCNAEDFKALRSALGSKVADYNFIPEVGSGYIETKMQNANDWIQNHPNLILGRKSSGGIIGKTGTSAFYVDGKTCQNNKLCTVKNLGDSIDNDAAYNQEAEPLFSHYDEEEYTTNPVGYGQTSNVLSDQKSNKGEGVTFFRDNLNRTVRTDIWRLREQLADEDDYSTTGFRTDEYQTAKETFVYLHAGGTPELELTTIQPLVNSLKPSVGGNGYTSLNNDDDNTLQNNSNEKIEKEGVTDSYKGSINRFNFKSQWASLDNKPHQLSSSWKYTVDMNRWKYDTIGMTEDGTNERVTKGATTNSVEVACTFGVDSADKNALISKTPYTEKELEDSAITSDFKADKNKYNTVKVLFSRAVSRDRDEN